jgi:hypothetical protein
VEDNNWETEACIRELEDNNRKAEARIRDTEACNRETEALIRAFIFLRMPYFAGRIAKTMKTNKNYVLQACYYYFLYLKKDTK